MKKLLITLISMQVFAGYAQSIDSAGTIAATYFKEARAACDGQKIWTKKLYGRIMFVDPATRMTWANMPDSAGILKPVGDVYEGTLPANVMIANTAITWEGKLWSVILWPLYGDDNDKLNLIAHESFHRIQDDLGLPGHNPLASHLISMNGRIYFLLELQALKAALNKPVGERTPDIAAALLFREKRKELFPLTFNNERILEMNEGLAEYTGVMLGRPKDSITRHLNSIIDNINSAHPTLIRSFAYVTGPVYGYLLYQKAPDWTRRIDSNSSFPALIAIYYHVKLPAGDIDREVDKLLGQYNGASIIISEKLKEAQHQKQLHLYLDAFTKNPVLTIQLQKMNINFNPNKLFDLGEFGTVYPTAFVKDIWGNVEVSEGGVLLKDWKTIYLPIAGGENMNGQIIEGAGWKLTLNNGWKIKKTDSLHYDLVKDDN